MGNNVMKCGEAINETLRKGLRNMKKSIWLPLFSLVIFIAVSPIAPAARAEITNYSITVDKKTTSKKDKPSHLTNLPVVVHGLGYIDGHLVTNSLDALLVNYKRGFRVFEIDLNMTSDHRLVARHDWTPEHYKFLGQVYPPVAGPIPFQTFMSLKIHGKYSPASWEQILALMQMYPDIFIITDTKEMDKKNVRLTFSYLVNTVKQLDPTLLNRIIPQIYHTEMLSYIKSYYDFKYVIYTLYHLIDIPSPEELANWSERHHITAIAAFPFRITEEMRTALQKKGIIIYAHTINNPKEAAMFKKKGIGIYTDYLFYNGKNFTGPTNERLQSNIKSDWFYQSLLMSIA
jgi:glycerophosphoryl diester phosphodiesterase